MDEKEPSEIIAEIPKDNTFIHIFLPFYNDQHFLIEIIENGEEKELVIYKELKEGN
jgi:hypothetical protein